MNRNINIRNATPTPLHGAHNPQVENTTVDQQLGPVSDGRSQEPGLGSQPGPASGTALFPGLSPTYSHCQVGLKLWAQSNSFLSSASVSGILHNTKAVTTPCEPCAGHLCRLCCLCQPSPCGLSARNRSFQLHATSLHLPPPHEGAHALGSSTGFLLFIFG